MSGHPTLILGEAVSFSTADVVLFLVVSALVAAFLVALVVVGAIGWYRLGRGQTRTFVAKSAWFIGLIDVGMLLAAVSENPIAAVPFLAHLVAFGFGYAKRGSAPPMA